MIDEVKTYIKELFAGNSGGHDYDHTLRVYKNAAKIAEDYTEADKDVVALAALLHDADDHKLFNTENNQNARTILSQIGVAPEKIDRICDVINSVSFSKNKGKIPETMEGKIVQDADRLDAMGAIGIARTFAYGGEHGRSLEESVQHFHDKLLLLKDGLHTEKARKMAEKRHAFLEDYLAELDDEM